MKQKIVVYGSSSWTDYELSIHGVYQIDEKLFVLSRLRIKRDQDHKVYGIPEDLRVSATVTVDVPAELPVESTILLSETELQQALDSFKSCKCLFSQTVAEEEAEYARVREARVRSHAKLEAFFAEDREKFAAIEAAPKLAAEQKAGSDRGWQTLKTGASVVAGLAAVGLLFYKCASGDKSSAQEAASLMVPKLM